MQEVKLLNAPVLGVRHHKNCADVGAGKKQVTWEDSRSSRGSTRGTRSDAQAHTC